MVKGSSLIGLNLVKVPSESSPGVHYEVDTLLGKCECTIGSSGAPCKHQFVVWASLKISVPNFMPFFSKEERMRFARIAIGDAALEDPSLFDDLRNTDIQIHALQELEIMQISDNVIDPVSANEPADITCSNNAEQLTSPEDSSSSLVSSQSKHTKESALKDLEESFKLMRIMVSASDADQSCLEGVSKFRRRLEKLSKNQIISALHKFGSSQYLRKKGEINRIASQTGIPRAENKAIGVQPSSVQRRKNKNGSRKRLLRGGSSILSSKSVLPAPSIKRKHGHGLSKNVDDNVKPAKKHSANMKSRSRPTYKKVEKEKKK